MNKTLALAAVAAALGSANAARASVTISTTPFAGYDAAAQHAVIDFDHALPAGFSVSGGLQRTADDGYGAQPAIADGVKGTSVYWSMNPGDPGVLLTSLGYHTISFLWGSMDAYNRISLLGQDGSTIASYSGDQVYTPSNGGQWGAETNRRVAFTSSQAIYGLRLESGDAAFEVDDFAFAQPVPEPATWAMMIVGFGAIGGTLRARRRQLAFA